MKMLTISLTALLALSGVASADTAAVQVIHNSPDPLAASVDIYLDESLAIADFAFLTATSVLHLPAGVEIAIGVAPGNSQGAEDIIASFPVTLAAGESYLVMATGVLDPSLPGNPDGVDTGFTLEISSPLVTTAGAGEVAILAYHGSPSAPAVDVQVAGGAVLVDDLTYREFAGYIDAPAVDLVLDVTPAMDNDTVVASFGAPLSALDGAGVVVFAAGYLEDDPSLPDFGLFVALADGTVLPLSQVVVATENLSWSGVKELFN